ncbi:hypothetical protein GTQ40_02880 [Flavobacteriaceae bacterium R38]|nr:hypothetical protein [Flavobacteriaceae bacterium R38]
MKNISKLIMLTVMLTSMVFLTSCSSDDDEIVIAQSQFAFNGQTISTPSGYDLFQASTSEIAFFTRGISYDIVKNGGNVTGSLVLINKVPRDANGNIMTGTYNIGDDDATIVINGDFNSEEDLRNKSISAESGIAVIRKSENEYTIDYNLNLGNNRSAIGTYIGTLESRR